MKREFKSGEVVLEVYDASLRIVMDRLLPPYEDNGECSYTINIAGNENFGGGFPREYVEKQVDEYLDTIRDFIKKLVEYVTDFSDMRDEDIELTKPIYENYDEDLQAFNETGIIRTDEEIKELYNCKGEFGSTDEVTDMSF